MKAAKIVIKGDVQGVNFRTFLKKIAGEMGVTGSVRNVPNGSIEILAQGPDLNVFISHCREGPPYAVVESVSVEEIEEFSAEEFEIIYESE